MNKDEIEIVAAVLIKVIRKILKEYNENGRYSGNRSPKPISILNLERRRGPARGMTYRKLPDPNPDQRRKTDFDSKSKAA
jgi:hypothetical protein